MCEPFHGYIDRPLVIWKRRRMIIGFFWGGICRCSQTANYWPIYPANWRAMTTRRRRQFNGWMASYMAQSSGRALNYSFVVIHSRQDSYVMWKEMIADAPDIRIYTHTHTHRLLYRYTTTFGDCFQYIKEMILWTFHYNFILLCRPCPLYTTEIYLRIDAKGSHPITCVFFYFSVDNLTSKLEKNLILIKSSVCKFKRFDNFRSRSLSLFYFHYIVNIKTKGKRSWAFLASS